MSATERRVVILLDRAIFWLSKHWLAVLNIFFSLYLGLPFLAPVLMKLGATGAGLLIHQFYAPQCHQLAQRSWYLFGPQGAYRLDELVALVGVENLPSYPWPSGFVGHETVGYKVALCQRDTAIYGAILVGGLLFGLLRRRVRPLPWWGYVGMGLIPVALDGGSQWISYLLAYLFPRWGITPRESTPLLRVVTGALFGIATVWLALPYVEQSFAGVRQTLQQRFGWE